MPDGNHDSLLGDSEGVLTACQADANITICNGAIDYNEVAENGAGGINSCLSVFNRVGNLVVENVRLLGGNKYAVLGGNLWSPRFRNIHFDTGSDGIHLSGSIHNIFISGLTGRTGDDVVAWTFAEAEYPMADTTPNEVIGMTVENVAMERSGSRGVLLAPDANTRMAGIKLRNISVRRATGPVILLDSPTGSSGTIQDIAIDGLSGGYVADGAKLVGVGDNEATTVEAVSIRNVRNCPIDSRLSGDLIRLTNGSTVKSLTIEDVDVVLDTGSPDARALVYALAGSTVRELFFIDCKTDGLGRDITAYKWCRLNGDTSSFGRVVATGGRLRGMGQLADHDSEVPGLYIVTGSLVSDTSASLLGGGKGFSAFIEGLVVTSGGVLNLWGDSKTYDLWLRNVGNIGGSALWNFGNNNTINLHGGDGSVKIDGSMVSPSLGAEFFNTSGDYLDGVGRYLVSQDGPKRLDR
jgi:hypothetical protein